MQGAYISPIVGSTPTSSTRIKMWLVQVDTGWACFGFDVDESGIVTIAAPIAAWMVGKLGRDMVTYWLQRGAEVTWQTVTT